MRIRVRITCHITNETFDITLPEHRELSKQYGSEENLQKYYVQHRFSELFKNGFSLDKVKELFQLELEETKELKEIVRFHKKTEIVSSIEASKTSHIKSDRSIKTFLRSFAKAVENFA